MNFKIIHKLSSIAGLLTIVLFQVLTIGSEVLGNLEHIKSIKIFIAYSIPLLIFFMAATGFSGFKMSRKRTTEIIQTKKLRTRIIAVNGIVILIPSAICLAYLASSDQFSTTFWIVQSVEIIIGLVNLTLLILNIRSGQHLKKYLAIK